MDQQEADRKLLFDLVDDRQGDPFPTRTAAQQFLTVWHREQEKRHAD